MQIIIESLSADSYNGIQFDASTPLSDVIQQVLGSGMSGDEMLETLEHITHRNNLIGVTSAMINDVLGIFGGDTVGDVQQRADQVHAVCGNAFRTYFDSEEESDRFDSEW